MTPEEYARELRWAAEYTARPERAWQYAAGPLTHVYPAFGRPHVLAEDCWCEPQPDPVVPSVLVHRASE